MHIAGRGRPYTDPSQDWDPRSRGHARARPARPAHCEPRGNPLDRHDRTGARLPGRCPAHDSRPAARPSAAPSSLAWRPPWWAGWLHVPVLSVGVVGFLDLGLGRVPGWPELALSLAAIALVVLGVLSLRSQALGPALCGPCPGPGPAKRVALTFDDGPDPRTTPRILEALGAAHATFFVVGERARAHPELIAAMRARGHAIASHGERHSWTPMMTVAGARRLVLDGQRSLRSLGIPDGPFFRPPFGLTTPPLQVAVRAAGLTLVGWSRRSWDTLDLGSADRFAVRLARRVRDGDIVLLHDGAEGIGGREPLGVAAAGRLVAELQSRGFRLITVAELASLASPRATDMRPTGARPPSARMPRRRRRRR
jgi:peptidoglycan/xylan/chitin deacetylase (PgdA/CDA1 family)